MFMVIIVTDLVNCKEPEYLEKESGTDSKLESSLSSLGEV